MPKLRESQTQRMQRIFRAAIRYGLERKGENVDDLAKLAPKCRSTVYRRLKNPGLCTLSEMLFYAPKFFSDRELCEMLGVEYHGTSQVAENRPA